MNTFKEKLVLLHHWKGMNWSVICTILANNPTLSLLNEFTVAELLAHFRFIKLPSSLKDLPVSSIKEHLNQYSKQNIKMITIFEPDYPALLKEIYQPPWVIFAKGNIGLLRNNSKIAVVGSRDSTAYGKMAIRTIFPTLIENDYTIVSGLARGIDALSHQTAMELGGTTIAVIAGGFNHLYPKENAKLGKEMMMTQLVISEYSPDTRPEKWHFPSRNRIISGVSRGTFVVEAKERSGSLITANFAVNDGREVFALPGNIFSPNSKGTNDLIKQGAKLVQTGEDIMEELQY